MRSLDIGEVEESRNVIGCSVPCGGRLLLFGDGFLLKVLSGERGITGDDAGQLLLPLCSSLAYSVSSKQHLGGSSLEVGAGSSGIACMMRVMVSITAR